MKTLEGVYRHPLRADGVTLAVFKREAGYLVIESRDGAATVSATLGLFDSSETALARAESRGQELLRQGYRKSAEP
jgi:hypothetical protein